MTDTERRENDIFIYDVAKELVNNGVIVERFWQKSDGTLDNMLSVMANRDFRFIHKVVRIKKNSGDSTRWMDNIGAIDNFGVDNDHGYVLVDENFGLHIVSSVSFKNYVEQGHENWLNTPGKNGQDHKDNPVRVFNDDGDVYLDNYEFFKH